DQLGQSPNRRILPVIKLGRLGGGKGSLIAPETVIESPADKLAHGQGQPFAPGMCSADHSLEKVRKLGLAATERGQRQGSVWSLGDPSRFGRRLQLDLEGVGRAHLAQECISAAYVRERKWQRRQCAGLPDQI